MTAGPGLTATAGVARPTARDAADRPAGGPRHVPADDPQGVGHETDDPQGVGDETDDPQGVGHETGDPQGVGDETGDEGRALIEVVFLAVLVLIPIVYLMAMLLRVQAATLAVSQAARDAGRLIEMADDPTTALADATHAARVALADQHVPDDDLQLRFVASGDDCRTGPAVEATLRAGAAYDVCVIAVVTLPGIPTVLSGSSNTVAGVYTVHIGTLREGP